MRKKKRVKRIFFLFSVMMCASLLWYESRNMSAGRLETYISYCAYPFLMITLKVTEVHAAIMSSWNYRVHGEKEYQKLLQKCDALQAELIALQARADVYDEIKEIKEFAQQYNQEHTFLVRILEKQCGPYGHFFLIEGGEDKGFKKDTAVVYKNCLVGKISQVFPWYSKVTLLTDSSCKVAAYCHHTKTAGIYCGTSCLEKGLLTHVSHLSEMLEGDVVFSSGEGLVFPKGFGIGKVDSCVKNEGDMQYKVTIKPFIDFNLLTYCFVIEKKL